MYLRAKTQTERQKWLVAFGSSKQQDVLLETCKFSIISITYYYIYSLI